MVTDTQESVRKTVTATVEGTETSNNGGPVVVCSIKDIDSRYATKFYNLKDAEIEELPRGATLRIIVERGGLKKDKDGNLKLGNYPNDYFWNYMGIAGDQEIPATPPPPIVTPAGDARQASIERQVAYKEAVALTMARRGVPIVADKFLDGFFSGEKYEEKEKLAPGRIPNWEMVAGFREWWNAVNRATDIGESILNRTYTTMAEELEGIPSVEDEVKEPDDEPETPKEKDDDHLF